MVAGVLLVVGVGGCGWSDPDGDPGPPPDEPLIIESGAPATVVPIDWDRPVESSGFYEETQWPKACDLMTDEEIATVLPQATVAQRVSGDQDFDLIGMGGTGGHITAVDSECTIQLDIPQAGLTAVPDSDTGPHITLTIDAAGTQGLVSSNFHPRGERFTTTTGECYDSTVEVLCRLDRLAFRLTTYLPTQYYGDEGWTDRYQVDGETTTFESDGRQLQDQTARRKEQSFLRESLDLRLAELVLAKG